MSRIKSKSKPMPEDFKPRFDIEPIPENLIDRYSLMQESYLYTDGDWVQIGRRFSQIASHKISQEALKWLETHSTDKSKIKQMKEDAKKELKLK